VQESKFLKKTDFELIDLALAGSELAFEELVNRYKKAVYYLAFRIVKDHEDAVDLSQEAFFRAYQSLKKFRKNSSFHTWLYRITVNLGINHLRRNRDKAQVELEDLHTVMQTSTLEALEFKELQEVVNKAIDRLPEKQKVTVILRVCHGFSHKEISQVLQCSVGTVKANYFHAIRNLRDFMKGYISTKEEITR
jgi:RNA polymerase sigma-70 factor (ECF subfamily)